MRPPSLQQHLCFGFFFCTERSANPEQEASLIISDPFTSGHTSIEYLAEQDPWTCHDAGKMRNALKKVERFEGSEISATSEFGVDNPIWTFKGEKGSGENKAQGQRWQINKSSERLILDPPCPTDVHLKKSSLPVNVPGQSGSGEVVTPADHPGPSDNYNNEGIEWVRLIPGYHEPREDSVSTFSTEYQIWREIVETSDYQSNKELTYPDLEGSPISERRDLLAEKVSDLPLKFHRKICVLLNQTIKMVADYRDLGERLGLKELDLRYFERLESPATAILHTFNTSTDGTVGTFIGHLEALGREDVISVIHEWMGERCPFQNNGETKAQEQRCQINKPSERLVPDTPGPTDVHLKNNGLPVNVPELDDKDLKQSSSEEEERRKRLELNREKLKEFHRRFCNNKRKLKESITSKLKSLPDVVAVRRGVNTEISATSKYAGATINIFVKCDRQQFLAKYPNYDQEPYVIMKHTGGRIIDQVFDGQLIYCAEQWKVPHLDVEQSSGTVGYWIPEPNKESSFLGVTAFHVLDYITENTGIDDKKNFQSYVDNCRNNRLEHATYPLRGDHNESECSYLCGLFDNLFDVGVVRHHGANQPAIEGPFQWPSILYELVVAEDYDLFDILQDYRVRSGEAVHVFHNGQSSTEDERKVGELSDVSFDIGLDEHGKAVESENSVISVEGVVVDPSDFSFLEFEVLEQMYKEFQSKSDESDTDNTNEGELNNNCESPTTSLAGDLSTSAGFSDEGAKGYHSSSDDIVQFMPRKRSLDSGIANLYFTHLGDSGCIYYIYIKRDNQLWKAPIAIHRCLYEGNGGQNCSVGSSIGQALMKIEREHLVDAWFDIDPV